MSAGQALKLEHILSRYATAFRAKVHPRRQGSSDLLMGVFGVTPETKAQAPQYWSRELGMCWEHLVRSLFEAHDPACTGPFYRDGSSPCDIVSGALAIDTKYRLGSGDSGTLTKLAANAALLLELGYTPTMLFLREDSLPSARTRMRHAGWRVLEGGASFDFIEEHTGHSLLDFLTQRLAHQT